MRRRTFFMFFLIALLAIGVYWIDIGWGGKKSTISIGGYQNSLTLRQGLDLQGGLQIIMLASCPQTDKNCDLAASMPAVIQNLRQRISGGLAVNDAVIRQQGSNRISIELPRPQRHQPGVESSRQNGPDVRHRHRHDAGPARHRRHRPDLHHHLPERPV